ncbi:MAG: hypothetical protein LBB38_00320, partial [Puniceicoccales bacterium]|nr:hypothetical protein [Puniceicoccales bacterium]
MARWIAERIRSCVRTKRRVETRRAHTFTREKFLPFGKSVLTLFTLSVAVAAICFSGQQSLRFHVSPGQILSEPIVAEFSFSYESAIQTQRMREKKAMRVAPVYKLEMDHFQEFRKKVSQLEAEINTFCEDLAQKDDERPEERRNQMLDFLADVNSRYGFSLMERDIAALVDNISQSTRRYLVGEGLDIMQTVMSDGIVDSSMRSSGGLRNYFLNLDLSEEDAGKNLRNQEDAMLYLRIHLGALDERRNVTGALFHILRHGIYPNLAYDKGKTDEKKEQAGASVKPVTVTIEEGETIVPAGVPANNQSLEKLRAYRSQLIKKEDAMGHMWSLRLAQFWETFAVLACAMLVVKAIYSNRRGGQLGMRLFFLATMLVANLLLLRFVASLWSLPYVVARPTLFQLLPYMTPLFAGAIPVTLELGRRGGIAFGALLSIFFTLMIGKNLDFFSATFLAVIIAVYQCHRITFKSQLLRVGTVAGLTLGISALA